MMFPLRDYQQRTCDALIRNLHNDPLCVIPTGGGKTVTASHVARRLNSPTLWVAHRRELVHQAARHLQRVGMSPRIVMAGEVRDMYTDPTLFSATPTAPPDAPLVYVASVQTLNRREVPRVSVAFVDEAHHASADGYADLFTLGVPVIGLTATPFRLDGKPLGEFFKTMVVGATTEELVTAGHLIAPKVYCAPNVDLSAVRTVAGDYNLKQLDAAVNRPDLIGDIVGEWVKHAEARAGGGHAAPFRTVCFAINVEHSKSITQAFSQKGVTAEHLDGNTPAAERDAILSRLASGATAIVSNVNVLTEGWDLPVLECLIIARPTQSLCLHLQMLGRVMRPAEGKTAALVLDHAGNHHRHGLVTRPLEYSLNGEVKALARAEQLGLRRCSTCGLMSPLGMVKCPGCQTEFPAAAKEITTEEGELKEFRDDSFEYRRQSWLAILLEAGSTDRSDGWAVWRYKERFGSFPVLAGAELVDVARATLAQKRGVYEGLVAKAEQKGFKPGWASHQYREIFGVWPSGFVKDVRVDRLQEKWAGHQAK
jgi:DNA repair protein RadD